MTLLDPDHTYGWHDDGASWREIKVATVLAVTLALAAILLF
jgi:hypothetical protein